MPYARLEDPARAVAGEVEDRRQLQLGGRTLAGGTSEVTNLDAPEVSAAAKFAVKTMMERSNSLTPATLARVVSARQQVRCLAPPPGPTLFPVLFLTRCNPLSGAPIRLWRA